MSKQRTRHLLAARYISDGTVLVANLKTNKSAWGDSVEDALRTLSAPDPYYNGSKIESSHMGWLTGNYPEGFVKIVLG